MFASMLIEVAQRLYVACVMVRVDMVARAVNEEHEEGKFVTQGGNLCPHVVKRIPEYE